MGDDVELLDCLRLAILEQDQVTDLDPLHELALAVQNDGVHLDQCGGGSEGRLLWGERARRDGQQDDTDETAPRRSCEAHGN